MVRLVSLFLVIPFVLSAFLCTEAFAQSSAQPDALGTDPMFVPREQVASEKSAEVTAAGEKKEAAEENGVVRGHGFQLGMTFISIPDGILDKFFTHHGSMWNDAVNMGMSFDYFLRFQAPCELRFSLSWVNLRTGDDYWLTDEYADRPALADYVVNKYHAVALEVAAYHVVQIIDEIAFYYGGGGWGGFILGDAWSYAIRSDCAKQADDLGMCPHEPGRVPMTGIPDFFGFVVVTLGFKFTLFDMMTIRAEGGFKGYFYGQLGLGIEF